MPRRPSPKSIARTVGAASGLIGSLGRAVSSSFSLPGVRSRRDDGYQGRPGESPGIESIADTATPPPPGTVRIRCVDYAPDSHDHFEVTDVEELFNRGRPDSATVRWINLDGLHPYVVDRIRTHYGFHTLAAEDILRTPQRPKVEDYEDHLFVVMRMLLLEEGHIRHEQVSFFLFRDTVITFQEHRGDVWDPIRERLQNPASRLRQQDASYLLYALLDAIVDHCFPVLESYGDRLEDLEEAVLREPTSDVQQKIYAAKRELGLLRRIMWPTREVANVLQRDETEEISPYARTYMRDVYDHAVQVMDVVETYRETASSLGDLYMSMVGNRMNEVMKVLTIMASFFIPVTFIAGVYGMNFEHMPELSWKYSYAVFWMICLGLVAGLGVYFWRKGWIGRE